MKYEVLAKDILAKVGGRENILTVKHCVTRLRFQLKDESKADTAIVPMQDILGLGKEARMNIPSTLGGNWVWRLDGAALTDELADKLKTMSEKSGRLED